MIVKDNNDDYRTTEKNVQILEQYIEENSGDSTSTREHTPGFFV